MDNRSIRKTGDPLMELSELAIRQAIWRRETGGKVDRHVLSNFHSASRAMTDE